MSAPRPDVDAMLAEAQVAIEGASSTEEIREVTTAVLGKRSSLALANRGLGGLEPEERRTLGARLHEARATVESLLERRRQEISFDELAREMAESRIDLTEFVPSKFETRPERGHLHLVSQTRDALEDVFVGMGFEVAEGPEVESDWFNFGALNIPTGHPAAICGTPSTWRSASRSRRCCGPTPHRCRSISWRRRS